MRYFSSGKVLAILLKCKLLENVDGDAETDDNGASLRPETQVDCGDLDRKLKLSKSPAIYEFYVPIQNLHFVLPFIS